MLFRRIEGIRNITWQISYPLSSNQLMNIYSWGRIGEGFLFCDFQVYWNNVSNGFSWFKETIEFQGRWSLTLSNVLNLICFPNTFSCFENYMKVKHWTFFFQVFLFFFKTFKEYETLIQVIKIAKYIKINI